MTDPSAALVAARQHVEQNDCSETELRKAMVEAGHELADVAAAVAELKQAGTVDDLAFARRETQRLIEECYGPIEVRKRLGLRSLDAMVINRVLIDLAESPIWSRYAKEHLLSKFGDPDSFDTTKKYHAYRGLQRRGYQETVIKKLIWYEMTYLDSPLEIIEKPKM